MRIIKFLTIIIFTSVGIFSNVTLSYILGSFCKENSECGYEQHCSQGLIVATCTDGCRNDDDKDNDSNCTRNLPKDSNKKICLDKTCVECKKSADCTFDKSKKYCVKNKCELECSADEQCQLEQICDKTSKKCIPGCGHDIQKSSRCPDKTPNCLRGSCRKACKSDAACDIGQNCKDFSCVPSDEPAN